MKERSIILRDWEVRAFLAGRKTRISRVVKPQPGTGNDPYAKVAVEDGAPVLTWPGEGEFDQNVVRCPFGATGDRLWGREGWWHHKSAEIEQAGFVGGTITNLDGHGTSFHPGPEGFDPSRHQTVWRKRPSLHMPRWASRITLEVGEITVRRVQDLTQEEARAHGVEAMQMVHVGQNPGTFTSYREGLRTQWDADHGPGAWERNDFIWTAAARRVEGER